MANRNSLWAEVLVDALVSAGLREVCLAPGSRSTLLVLAFAARQEVESFVHLDERCAAFFALGLAKAKGRPTALVCTSGTAAANFYPAVIEAHQSGVPLLVLSADRPHELRGSGANQSIDQIRLYGSYANWSVDVALPEAQPSDLLLRSLQTTAARAYAHTLTPRPGVVHLNLPFRKPLEPTPVPGDQTSWTDRPSVTRFITPAPRMSEQEAAKLAEVLGNCRHGLIICGVDCPRDKGFVQALRKLSKHSGFPILADAASGLRFIKGLNVLDGYDNYLRFPELLPKPDIVLRFGCVPTSKTLNAYLDTVSPEHQWQVSSTGIWADDRHVTSLFLQVAEADFCAQLASHLSEGQRTEEGVAELERSTWQFWDEMLPEAFSDFAAVHHLVKHLPDEAVLFVGNSLAVRHLDQFGHAPDKVIDVYANRGASGIDGNLSTALGLGAANRDKPLFILLGDVSFYHDMNGLLALKQQNLNATVILLNNGGGGIFHRLPINQDAAFERFFLTPQSLDFSHAARLYGLEHHPVTSLDTFEKALNQSASETASLIEVRTNSYEDAALRDTLMKRYEAHVKGVKETA